MMYSQGLTLHLLASREIGNPHRVRRGPGLSSRECGALYPHDRLVIKEIRDGWGKLHDEMYPDLEESEMFSPFDVTSEGWTLLHEPGGRVYWKLSDSEFDPSRVRPADWPCLHLGD
jgi:hypothetical protein